MGLVQRETLKTTILSSVGLVLGYVNKAVLFLILLSPEQVGLVNLTVTVGLLFSQFANLGTIYSVWRFFPFFHNGRGNYGFLFLNVLIVLLGVILMSLVVFIFSDTIVYLYDDKSSLFVEYYLWIIPIGVAHVYYVLFDNYLRSLHNNVLSVFLNEIMLRLMVMLLLLLLYLKCIGFHQFFIFHALLYFLPTAVLFFYLIKKGELTLSLKSIQVSNRFRRLIFYFSSFSYVNTLAVLLVISMDAMMIAHYISLKATAVYTTVIYITSAVMVPYRSLIRVSSPLVALHWKNREITALQNLYTKSSSVGLYFAILSFSVIWFPIKEIFSFIPEYSEGIYVFLFIMIGRMVDMFCGLNGTIFSTSRKYKYDLIFSVFLCLSVFYLNLLLIPVYGIIGAAISTSLAYVVYNILRCWYIFHYYKLQPMCKQQLFLLLYFTLFFSLMFALDSFLFQSIAFSNVMIPILMKWLLIFLGLVIPVYCLNLEKESTQYVKGLMATFRKKKATSI
ncbi:MAG: polysaccharide biosynthesis C-terminal domain-containing protein [Bacteroidetes bacterium]|nr:polysaccharide biosynthesis C-terminal domain-containing protein [Bacteroidota bacterium]